MLYLQEKLLDYVVKKKKKCDPQPGEKWSMEINVEILQILALYGNLLNLLKFTDSLQITEIAF